VATWTHDDAIEWAESMVEPLVARAQQAEQLRQVPQETIDECNAVDAFALVSPKSVGGHGLGLQSLTHVTRILGHGCVSSSWTIGFLMLHNWFIARSPQPLQDAVFGDSTHALVPCPLAPTGTAVPVDGGYSVTGRWKWATGVMHGDWVMVNTMVKRDGEGPPESRFCMLPMDQIEIDDIWHTSGMRGTGSNDAVAENVFVPEHNTVPAVDLRGDNPPGAAIHRDPWTGYAFTPVLCLLASSPALGGAEAAVDHYRDLARDRVLPYSLGDKQAEQQGSQIRLSEARSTVRAARLVWQDAIDTVCDTYDAGGIIERVDRAPLRLATAQVVRLSRQAVTTATEGAGASVYFTDSPLQRIQRDLETLKGHVVYDWDRVAQLAGRLELGSEPLPTDML
jgi:3-hydroxy-9,10-secoandrosta-1,3,5(10)-triene-9,17-dione monooxygenase